MSKRTIFTTVTPLPAGITRETVLETLHDHSEMIILNPLVEEYHPIKPPPNATAEEYHCLWYSLTDRVQYLPGGMISGKVSYNVCFHDLDMGLQTHCYAPMGLNIKGKWTLGGTLQGEPVAPVELGVGVPLQGLWLREDVDMKCNIMMTSFVKKTLKKAHSALVDRLLIKAQIVDASANNQRLNDRSVASQGQFAGSQASQYAPSSRFDASSVEDGTPGSSGYNSYGPQGAPMRSPGFRSQEHSDFRDNTTADSNIYPKPLSVRSSSASYTESMTGSQSGRASYQESTNGIQGGRVSWQNLNPVRSPSSQNIDPAYQNANPYGAPSPSYNAVELPSHGRPNQVGRQDSKGVVHEMWHPDHSTTSYGPAELE